MSGADLPTGELKRPLPPGINNFNLSSKFI
jgi:hypothetical protein